MQKTLVALAFGISVISSVSGMESQDNKRLSIDLKIKKIKMQLYTAHCKKKCSLINKKIFSTEIELARKRLENLEHYRRAKHIAQAKSQERTIRLKEVGF